MRTLLTALMMLTMSVVPFGCGPDAKEKEKEKQLQKFVTAHVEKIKPMEKETNLASWDAAVTGKSEDYDKLSKLTLRLRQVYTNSQEFAFLKDMKESGEVKDAKLARQLDVLHNAYLKNQIEPELLKKILFR
jgi:peptidyl-dipeptidase A